jgi:hypothetical protein
MYVYVFTYVCACAFCFHVAKQRRGYVSVKFLGGRLVAGWVGGWWLVAGWVAGCVSTTNMTYFDVTTSQGSNSTSLPMMYRTFSRLTRDVCDLLWRVSQVCVVLTFVRRTNFQASVKRFLNGVFMYCVLRNQKYFLFMVVDAIQGFFKNKI